jgi:hypothetical protein
MDILLVKVVETYQIPEEADVIALIERAKSDPSFELIGYTRKLKEVKQKGEVVDSYYIVTLTKKMA